MRGNKMNDFRYTARQLLEVKRWFDANPDGVLRVPIWPKDIYTEAEWRAWFMKCLHDKINRGEGKRGRKDCQEWQAETRRASRQLNTPRLIVRWLPYELRKRFARRLET